jgi:hypothetical protein
MTVDLVIEVLSTYLLAIGPCARDRRLVALAIEANLGPFLRTTQRGSWLQ